MLGAIIRPIAPRHKHILFISTFPMRSSSKIISNYFQLFKIKVATANTKFEKENSQNPLNRIQFSFDMPLVDSKISADEHCALRG